MGNNERKGRERAEREQRIVEAARAIAEQEGWNSVTIRRLADEIEYSQPVLYSHFANRDAIVAAVALKGFSDLALALRYAANAAQDRRAAAETVARAYLAFAMDHPALYDAMFTLPTGLRFAEEATRPELKEAFAALAAAFSSDQSDGDTLTETFWAALHGLAELERSHRIRPGSRDERLALVIDALMAHRMG